MKPKHKRKHKLYRLIITIRQGIRPRSKNKQQWNLIR